jgi:hypothetical protein
VGFTLTRDVPMDAPLTYDALEGGQHAAAS